MWTSKVSKKEAINWKGFFGDQIDKDSKFDDLLLFNLFDKGFNSQQIT